MSAGVRRVLGLAVAIISFVGSIIICALPQWRVTKISDYLVSEGLWKLCVTVDMLPTQCRAYDSPISITQELVGGRALIVIAIIAEVIGILLVVAGSKFINFVPDERKKSKMTLASGVVFLIAGFFVLIPVCWIANTISGNFYSHLQLPDPPKMELGACVYIGWITTGLLFLGGGLLCSSFPRRDGTD